MARNVISIDPGRVCLTVAKWADGELLWVGLSQTKTDPAQSASVQLAALCAYHAKSLSGHMADLAVVERMQHYPSTNRRETSQARDAKANDLLELAAIGMYVAGKLANEVALFSANEWKGTADETASNNRVVRELSEAELAVLEKAKAACPSRLQHNLYDATGLGLRWHGRYKNGRW